MTPKKSRLRGWDLSGEIRAEILISIPAMDVQNGAMASQLVTKRCDFGPLGFRAQLAHPASLDPGWALGPGPSRSYQNNKPPSPLGPGDNQDSEQ